MASILFVGGGSVGHIAPSVAIWEQCQTLRSDLTAHFVCSPRPDDAAFLQDNNLHFTVLDAPRASLLFPIKFAKAVRKAKKILDASRPDTIFCKGGYVSLPICYEAHRRNIPIVLHESDSVSGYANRIVGRWAKQICTGFPSQFTHTGNPVRANIAKGSKKEGLQIAGFDGTKPVLLVIGGSQGAKDLNDAVHSMLDDLLLRCDIIHITGRGKTNHQSPITNHYYQTEFVNEELKHLYACTDLALSRAGAGSIAELAVNGIPTILVPLREVGHDHQYKNAIAAEKTGGCMHLEEGDLAKKLLPTVHEIISNTGKRSAMAEHIRQLGAPDAALQIAKIIVQPLDSGGRDQ